VLRTVLAPNASPLTLDGTRTHIVGQTEVAVIDPGSDDPGHLDAIAGAIGDGVLVAVLVTHGHPDHRAGAAAVADRHRSRVRSLADGSLRDGDEIPTDAGRLVAVATPGHTRDHTAFHWPAAGAVFCGDLMMGGHDTALVAPPEGRLGPYLASLERVRELEPGIIHPAHGPSFTDPGEAIERYVRHREDRLRQVLDALEAGSRDYDALRTAVYGDALDPGLERAATAALKAYLEHLQARGRARRIGRGWEATEA
jgi:glyoxylase-like metal-dependent hydrolase (beta-lactamase superfamily II)